MKRLTLAAALLLASTACALAQTNGAPGIATPAVFPETGENSAGNSQIMSIARLKLGYCVATATGAEATEAATCNGAQGQITTSANVTVVSGAKDILTVTNPKVLATDSCMTQVDDTGAAGASAPFVSGCKVSAGQLIISITNASATSPAAALKIYFMVLTGGNPH